MPVTALQALQEKIKTALPTLEFTIDAGVAVPSTTHTVGPALSTALTGATLRLDYFGVTNSQETNRNEAVTLFSILETDEDIVSLLANGSTIDDVGADSIANFLKKNIALKILDLHLSHISENGLLSILDALTSNQSLQFLNIRANSITLKVLSKLLDILQNKNTHLRQIELTQNNYANEKAFDKIVLDNIAKQLQSNLAKKSEEKPVQPSVSSASDSNATDRQFIYKSNRSAGGRFLYQPVPARTISPFQKR